VRNLKLRKHKLSCGNGRTQPIALPSPLTQSEDNNIILSGNYKRRLSCNSAVVGSVMLRAEGRGSTDTCNSVFIPGIFFVCGGGDSPLQKTCNFAPPPNGCQIVCSKSFSQPDNELQLYHGNMLLIDNKNRKLFVIKQSRECRFVPKMHQNTFSGRAPPGPVGGAYTLPKTS